MALLHIPSPEIYVDATLWLAAMSRVQNDWSRFHRPWQFMMWRLSF